MIDPRRERVYAAKRVAAGAAAVTAGLGFVAVNAALALPALDARGLPLPATADLVAAYAGSVAAVLLGGLLGVGLSTLVRQQVTAIVIAVGLFLVLGGIGPLLGDVKRVLPAQVVQALQGGSAVVTSSRRIGGHDWEADVEARPARRRVVHVRILLWILTSRRRSLKVDQMRDLHELLAEAGSDEPAAALRACAELRRELEREEEGLVHRARVAGLSWVAIAGCLGVTKQAVHKKYAGRRLRRR